MIINAIAQNTKIIDAKEKYKPEWKTVDSLDQLGLPKSALLVVESIYTKAKADQNNDQVLKAIIHRIKYLQTTEENYHDTLLHDIDNEIAVSSLQNKSLLYSVKADLLLIFYRLNNYKIQNRSNTVTFKENDLNSWTSDQLINGIIKNYLKSLEPKDSLFKTSMEFYDEIISFGKDSRELRPTLYDFLASKALQFFQRDELTLHRSTDFFQVDKDQYFNQAADFIKMQIICKDSLSMHYYALKIYQDWLGLRLSINNQAALTDLEINRLKFIFNCSISFSKNELYLNALKQLRINLEGDITSAQVDYEMAIFYKYRSSNYNVFDEQSLKYKFDNKTALEICNAALEKYPESYGANLCKSIKAEILSTSLDFTIEEIVAPNSKIPVLVNYSNLEKIYTMVGKIDPNEMDKIFKQESGEKLYNKLLNSVAKIQTSAINLKGNDDFNNHSTEILLNHLSSGTYVVFVANNEKFGYQKNITSYAIVRVTGIACIQRTSADGSSETCVLDRNTGKPLKNVQVKAWNEEYNYNTGKYNKELLGTFTTDTSGYFKLSPDKKNFSGNVNFEFFNGSDYYSSRQFVYLQNPDKKTELATRVFLFTNREIYRPGQTVYFKGIALKSDGESSNPEVNKSMKITFYDVNFQKVAEQTFTTNEFGSFNGTFSIPQGLLNGNMQLYSVFGSKYISVEEYKRPKFEVEILPVTGNYVLNDSVKISGKAIAFSGSTISGAKVQYRIVRKPFWSGWWFYNLKDVETQMTSGETTTNEKGEFEFSFMAQPDFGYEKNEYLLFDYNIIADVTDLNGETQSVSKSVMVGNTAMKLNLELDQDVNRETVKDIEIKTVNINGEFVEAKGGIKIYKLKGLDTPLRERKWNAPDQYLYSKEEWDSIFPGNVYNHENDLRYREKEKQMATLNFNTAESEKIDFSFMKDWEPGVYVAETESKDAFGNPVKWNNYFTLYSTVNQQIPDKFTTWLVQLDKTAEPGNMAKFIFGSELPGLQVLYEIEFKNNIVEKKWIQPSGKQILIEIPVKEEYRGNFSVHFTCQYNNRFYKYDATVIVPRTNKMLDISFETFRDRVSPGSDEEWKIKIKGKNGEKVAAEFLATLYDASLDQFRPNYWGFNIYNSYYSVLAWNSNEYNLTYSSTVTKDFNPYIKIPFRIFDNLNWFGFKYYGYEIYNTFDTDSYNELYFLDNVRDAPKDFNDLTINEAGEANLKNGKEIKSWRENDKNAENGVFVGQGVKYKITESLDKVKVRTNFNETAFFYPNLQTDEEGNVIVKFKIPESLTSWKMMGFAHTRDFKYGFVTNELKTQKDLMLMPNEPRFFRQNDKLVFPVKISNLSKNKMTGTARLEILDALTMKQVEGIFDKKEIAEKSFEVSAGGNSVVEWNLSIPENINALTYKVVARSGDYADGEQKAIPVLSDRMLVTESLPFHIKSNQAKDFELTKLVKMKKSQSLKNYNFTLEYTANPAWYAVQALPYFMEYPNECTEQTFSRFYANSIAANIANSSPKVKQVFESWKNTPGSDSFLSNLEKNQELKSALLEETSWVFQAENEQEQKKRIGLLFDINHMANETGRAIQKLQKAQYQNGSWPWFDGMPESRYITQYIVQGFGHLDHLGIKSVRQDEKIWKMLVNAIHYLDNAIREDYQSLKRNVKNTGLEKNHLNPLVIHYLYGRSFFSDVEIPDKSREAYSYYMQQSEKYWLSQDLYSKGMMAIYLKRNENKVAGDIVKSLKEISGSTEEMGMYWKDNKAGYYWYQAPVETQALMIEVFKEVAQNETDVEALKVWLLKQKQTQNWKTTKATAEAIYALLLSGKDWLNNNEPVKIKVGENTIEPAKEENNQAEAGTGYYKTSWKGSEIKPEMGKIHVEKKSDGIAWGSIYWQYFEDLDEITPHETPLKLDKKLFVEKVTASGKVIEPIDKKTSLKIGDKVIVRIELKADRDMEYIHMKDMRAAGFEPINDFSRYKYQDGLGYYESTKDASTSFFISFLPKGNYVFEYPLRVTHQGEFSNGVTTIQCMYAPEFSSHSEGKRIKVEK
ncbi:MAG: alpha-2-macroglobulin family protein [Bacteroidales bacterium]